MPETLGTLELKIARLQKRLDLLKEQQALSQPYPTHLIRLFQESAHLQQELERLKQRRSEFLRYAVAI